MERDSLIETARYNTAELLHDINSAIDMEGFLSNEDEHLNVRSTNATLLEQSALIDFDYDIDGVVVELHSLSGIAAPVFYLKLNSKKINIQPCYHIAKKHFDLSTFTGNGLKSLQNCHGIHLCYTMGYRVSLCLVPDGSTGAHDLSSAVQAKSATQALLTVIGEKVSTALISLSHADNGRPSVQKNSLHDLSNNYYQISMFCPKISPSYWASLIRLLQRQRRQPVLNS